MEGPTLSSPFIRYNPLWRPWPQVASSSIILFFLKCCWSCQPHSIIHRRCTNFLHSMTLLPGWMCLQWEEEMGRLTLTSNSKCQPMPSSTIQDTWVMAVPWHCVGHHGPKDKAGMVSALQRAWSSAQECMHTIQTQGSWVGRETMGHGNTAGDLGKRVLEQSSEGQAEHCHVGGGKRRLPAQGLGVFKFKVLSMP